MSDLLQRESVSSKEDTVSTDDADSASSSHPILQLTCGICKARYTDPRLLPCLHSFCNICIKTLDSFVIQGSNVGEKGRPKSVVLCPTCNCESVLPASGSGDFPVDFLLQKALLYDALDPHSGNLTCDLCTDDAKALSRCVECMVNICGFCCQAHKRQKKTASHTVLSFLEARRHSAKQLQCPVYCSKHQQEELKFYCETCDHSVCRDCCLVEHRDHLVEYVEDVGTHHKKVLSSLLSRLEPHIEAVKRGIDSSDRLEVAIAERSASIKVDIEDHFEAYIQALHKHKRSLLQSVTQISSNRTKAVQSQKLQFQQILGDLQHTYDITSTALQDGTNTEILSIKPTLSQRLCDLLRVSYQSAPSLQEASLQFKAKAVSENSNPFHIRGIISTSTAEPSQTFVEGEGCLEPE
ncbi:Tripartite motif-containing protein 45 [Holothuria leucospilota]|uniref:Tripartite motif-containing protein 45 n=1 Tax=Holothuria leucospilota TaxID=206669 RepID=A0A9Q1C6H4_HOLLE|nr:Tripartite motif-containing protein 45 [Holothuria leucospilota]